MREMAMATIDSGNSFPEEQVDMERGVQWRVFTAMSGGGETVWGWALKVEDGALVVYGAAGAFVKAWGGTWQVERVQAVQA